MADDDADRQALEIAERAYETVLHDQRQPTGVGPIRIIAEDIAAAIRAAVAAERERLSGAARARELLAALTPEQRLDAFSPYCPECGIDNPQCQCWNDE
jgi:hypothetical protein